MHAPIGQLPLNGRPIGLGGTTSEIFYVETSHRSIIWANWSGSVAFATALDIPVIQNSCCCVLAIACPMAAASIQRARLFQVVFLQTLEPVNEATHFARR
jgi:hypothetical protein